jgi:hypothetical protein
MRRICVVCEFVTQVLAPTLHAVGINLVPEMIETSRGHKGGALRYERVKRHLRNTLSQNSRPIVTTLFDLYRLDKDFPSFEHACAQTDLNKRLGILNTAMHSDVVKYAKCQPDSFIPHIQPYEFEALLFSDVGALVSYEPGWESAFLRLSHVRAQAASPEHINDQPQSKPSAHLARELRNPSYRKTMHGPMIARKIGLHMIEEQCAFFALWLAKIRRLACE